MVSAGQRFSRRRACSTILGMRTISLQFPFVPLQRVSFREWKK